MERLTFYDDHGKACYRYNGVVYRNEIAKRLAAYEEMGLEPEELKAYRDAGTPEELDRMFRDWSDLRIAAGMDTLDRMWDAIHDGRIEIVCSRGERRDDDQ